MKNKKFYFIICIIIAIFLSSTYVAYAFEEEPTANVDATVAINSVNIDGILLGELNCQEVIQNQVGQTIRVYSDDSYQYFVSDKSGEISLISMNGSTMEEISAKFEDGRYNTVSDEQAEKIMFEVIKKVFPEYSVSNLSIKTDNETGSSIERFRYYIEELHDDYVVNVASVSIAFNGEVSFISGTHNTIDMFKSDAAPIGSDDLMITKEDLPDIVAEYIVENVVELEKSRSMEKNYPSHEKVIAAEGMLLPDGVSIGEEFTIDTLPEYQVYCDNADDISIREIKKVMRSGTVLWEVNFMVHTSWGEYDSALNPNVVMYIDPINGHVVEMYSSNG